MVSAVLPACQPLPPTPPVISPGARWRSELGMKTFLPVYSFFFLQNDLKTRPNLSPVAFPELLLKDTGSFLIWPQLFVDVLLGELINGKKHFHPECVLYYTWLRPQFFFLKEWSRLQRVGGFFCEHLDPLNNWQRRVHDAKAAALLPDTHF